MADVIARGPVFDGTADMRLQLGLNQAREQFAEEGMEHLRDRARGAFRNPTPIWWTRLRTEHRGFSSWIRRPGLPYDYWLEGRGSRNRGRPGFPGYGIWASTYRWMDARIVAWFERAVADIVRSLQ